jgi:hexosaminidase
LDVAKTKYAPSVYDPSFKVRKDSQDRLVVILESEVEGLDLHYTFDNSFPDEYYPKYTEPLVVPIDADKLRVISYRNGKPIGRMQTMPVEELKRRVEKPE